MANMLIVPQGTSTQQNVRAIRLPAGVPDGATPLGKYNAATDSYDAVNAKVARWIDTDGTTIRRWARAAPDPTVASVTLTLDHAATGSPNAGAPDQTIKYAVPTTPTTGFTGAWVFRVRNYQGTDLTINTTGTVSTTDAYHNVSGNTLEWLSEWTGIRETGDYSIIPKLTLSAEQNLPSEYDSYRQNSNQVTGSTVNYTESRADQ